MNFSYTRVEGLIREEEERAAEHNASIVPGLQGGNQHSLTTNCMRILLNLKKSKLFMKSVTEKTCWKLAAT